MKEITMKELVETLKLQGVDMDFAKAQKYIRDNINNFTFIEQIKIIDL